MPQHPLSSRSRRRRMTIYLLRQQAERESATPVVALRPTVGPSDKSDPHAVQVAASETETKKVRKGDRPAPRQRLTSHQHQLRVRALLSQEAPANWVFCGDSLLAMSDRSRDWPSYVGHFSHFVRWQIRRFPDMVIDACLPSESLSTLCSQFNRRVLRFTPQAVFIMCGMHEATTGLAGLPPFEAALQRMLRGLLERGITPIVHTPPCPSEDPQPDQLVYVEAIRSITAEQDVPLIDHWEFWEIASAAGRSSAWYEPECSLPGKTGHEQIAEQMLRTLALTTQVVTKAESRL